MTIKDMLPYLNQSSIQMRKMGEASRRILEFIKAPLSSENQEGIIALILEGELPSTYPSEWPHRFIETKFPNQCKICRRKKSEHEVSQKDISGCNCDTCHLSNCHCSCHKF